MKYLVAELQTRARRVWAEGRWICIELVDGRQVRFAAEKNRHLRKATDVQLAAVELIDNGTGLHWPDLDEDLSVLGILEGRLGQA